MRVGRRCFVSNLAWRTSWQDLKDKFRECGNVVYANVIRDEGGELSFSVDSVDVPINMQLSDRRRDVRFTRISAFLYRPLERMGYCGV